MLNVSLIIVLVLYEISYVTAACSNERNEAIHVKSNDSNSSLHLCPAESESDIKKLKKFSTTYSFIYRYCLFNKTFQPDQEKLCSSEIKPIFKMYYNKETNQKIKCDFGYDRVLHYFGYLELYKHEMKHEAKDISMYDVCYNMSTHETIYTTHKIREPSIFQDQYFPEEFHCRTEISTEPFYMKLKSFFKMKKYYEAEKKKKPKQGYKMLPHPMVPPQHFAYRTWQKPINHYINMAPLWETLILLMNVIDEGIKKAALKVFQLNQSEELLIFTKIEKLPKREYNDNKSKKWFKWFGRNSRSFQPNIWYKFVYNEKKKEGVMIYIHNTPGELVERKCSSKKVVICNFQTWSAPKDPSDSSIESIDFQYAYCCHITAREAEEIFYHEFAIETFLNIDALIKNTIE